MHYYDALKMVTPTGFEPVLPPWKGGVLTAWPRGHLLCLKQDKIYINIIFILMQVFFKNFFLKL